MTTDQTMREPMPHHQAIVRKVPPTRSMQNYYTVACACGWKGAGYLKGREGAEAGYRGHIEMRGLTVPAFSGSRTGARK